MSKFVKSALLVAFLVVSGAAFASEKDDKDGGTGQKSDVALVKDCCRGGAKCDVNSQELKSAIERIREGRPHGSKTGE